MHHDCRAEVNKCSITHWFSNAKAERELGYRPRWIPFEETVAWFRDRGYSREAVVSGRRARNRRPLRDFGMLTMLLAIVSLFMIWLLS